MASRWKQICQAIEAAIVEPPSDNPIHYGYGRLAQEEQGDYPRIVWMPVEADLNTARHDVGGRMVAGSPDSRAVACVTRSLGVDAEIWGGPDLDDVEATEQLVHAVIAGAYSALTGSVAFQSERWPNQEQTADYAVSGASAIVRFVVLIPVLLEDKDLTTISAEAFTAIFQGRTGDEQQWP